MLLILLQALFYAYPVCLACGLLLSHLILYRRKQNAAEKLPSRKVFRTIWWLQAVLVPLFLAGTVLALLAALRKVETSLEPPTLQAIMGSYIGVMMYFAAGLLPDPDGPFEPTKSNLHTWFMALAFEITTLGLLSHVAAQERATQLETGEALLSSCRILVLGAMCFMFLLPKLRDYLLASTSSAETSPLIPDVEGGSTQPDAKGSNVFSIDAQSTGWLDYFIGFKTLLPYIWPSGSPKHQVILVICFLLLVLQRLVNVLVPYQLGVLTEALGHGKMPSRAIAVFCFWRALQGQQGVVGSIRAILWIPISQLLYRQLTCAAFEHVLLLSLDFHLSKRIGEVMTALSKGGALNTFLDSFAFQLFPMVFDLGIAAVWLFIYFDAFYSIVVLGVMWSYIFVTIYMAKYRGRARREMAKRDREMDAAKTDAMMAYETVHHNCAVEPELSRFTSLVRSFQKAEYSVQFSLNGLNAIQNFIFTVGVILICTLSAYQISQGTHKVSDFVALITYFTQLHAPLAFFGSFYTQVQNNLVDAERMLDLFHYRSDVVDRPDAVPMDQCSGDIKLSHVDFHYATGKVALKDVSIEVKPGKTTAIVGESGSGKSTLLKLLFRFYDPNGGSISVDGRDIRDVTVASLRSYIGVVPQDTILFNDTIMYNLMYAKPDASLEEVYAACTAASIHHRIVSFPEGYETKVGERGLKLSGGEKQRVAIARAILKNPQIILLDEATASLDSHTEKLIQTALETVTRGRTTVTIAHRLSTITQADQIVVLHDGAVVETGTHAELLALNGRYRAMWDKQTLAEEVNEEK